MLQERRRDADVGSMPAWMDHPLARARLAVVFLAVAPVYFLLTRTFDGDVLIAGMPHAVLNSAMAVVALVTAGFVSRAAWQRHDIRAALVASGFTATGGLLLVHALATPGGPIFDCENSFNGQRAVAVLKVRAP